MNTLEVKVPTLLPTFNQCQCEDSVFVKVGSSSNYLESHHGNEHDL